MGQGYKCKCNKCDYSFYAYLGVGLMFPEFYQETVEKMKNGEYGVQGKNFFRDHPDGAISCNKVVARCTSCGEYLEVPELSMYIPKPDYILSKCEHKELWSVAFPFEDVDYVSESGLEEHYNLYEKYHHICPKCHSKADIIPDFEKKLFAGKLGCAKCDGTLKSLETCWRD